MKKIITITLLLIVAITVNSQEQNQNRYAIKSGHIEYELTGNTTGLKSIWWDNYGYKTRIETKSKTVTKMFGIKSEQNTNTVEIMVGENYWTANLDDNTGQTGINPFYNDSYELLNDLTEAEKEQLADDIISQLGGERLGTETFFGYTCEVIKLLGAKSWTYNGVTLKVTAKIMGIEANETVVKFEENISVSSSKFNPISNINYEKVADLQQNIYDEDSGSQEEEDYEITPLKYSFDKFKQAVIVIKNDGYKKLAIMDQNGEYMASFMKGFGNMISISAIAESKEFEQQLKEYESFSCNGRECRYSAGEDEGLARLIVYYKEHEMYIIINSMSGFGKDELIKINDMLEF